MIVAPGSSVEATTAPTAAGLVGTINFKVIDPPAGTVMVAETTAGITEVPTGVTGKSVYTKTFTAPASGKYLIVWENGTDVAVEELEVTTVATLPSGTVVPGGRTRADLREEVLANSFDPGRYSDLVNDWLNEALGRVSRRVRSLQRRAVLDVTTTAGQPTIALPVDFIRAHSLIIPTYHWPLEEQSDTDEFWALPSGTGRPEVFHFDSSTSGSTPPVTITPALWLWPTPDRAYAMQLRYTAAIPKLTADEHSPAMPEDYHHLLVSYARSKAFRAEDDFEAANYFMTEFVAGLREMSADLDRQTNRSTYRTPGMFSRRRGSRPRRPGE